MDLVKVKNLTYSYPEHSFKALSGVDFKIEPGEFVLLLGESGSGKSTLCKALNGLVPHFFGGNISGSVHVRGIKTTDSSVSELSKHVGMVFQDPENQLVTERIESELAFGLENTGVPNVQMKKRVQEVLATLRLSPFKHKRLQDLSGGQKQKVALASVLVMHPELIVLDEPTSQLDPISSEDFLATIKSLNDDLGLAVLLTEHRIEKCFHFADRVVVLANGKISFDGPPKELVKLKDGPTWIPLPPITELFAGNGTENIPVTVKEGREKIISLVKEDKVQKLKTSESTSGPRLRGKQKTTSSTADPFLNIKNIYFTYPDGTEALKGIDLEISRGESIAIIGENGSGKSTLIKHFNGLLKPQRGKVKLLNKDVSESGVSELAKFCGMLGQNPNLQLIAKTVEGELKATLDAIDVEQDRHSTLIDKTLRDFSLETMRSEYPQNLSCGQRERLALASIVVYEPSLLILDEPTRGIDKRTKLFLDSYLRRYKEMNNTFVLVTHDLEFAAGCCDRFILMSEGVILADGSRNDILAESLFFTTQFNKSFRGIVDGVITLEDAKRVLEVTS